MSLQLNFHCAPCEQVPQSMRDRVQIHLLPQPNQITRTEDCTHFPSTIKVSAVNVDESNKLPRVLKNDVQVFDVARYLVEGQNLIGVEANNFIKSVGFVNIYLQYEVKKRDRTTTKSEVISDGTWLFQEAPDSDTVLYRDSSWTRPDFSIDTGKWKRVKMHGPPPKINYDLYKPDLLANEQSYAEEFFGYLSYFYYEVYFVAGKRKAGIARRIAPFNLKRIMSLR